jgi:predicted nucleic acid-binding protein
MPYMADTNILLRFVAPTDPNHAQAIRNCAEINVIPIYELFQALT